MFTIKLHSPSSNGIVCRGELQFASTLFDNVPDNSFFYFVNSFALEYLPEQTTGKTSYGIDFASAVQKDNFYAVQFHPEKSGEVGMQVLKNFLEI